MQNDQNTTLVDDNAPAPTMAEAISALAEALKPKDAAPRGSRVISVIKGFAETVLPSIVMFVLGYIFVQGVQLDLKRQEFTASSADKVKSYVETIMTSTPATAEEITTLRATALALGGFGGVAAYPLVATIEAGGEQRIAAAKSGLEQAARISPNDTCPTLATIIDDVTGAYSWGTQKVIAEVAGLAGCRAARLPLQRLRGNVDSIAAQNSLDSEQRTNFDKTIEDALTRIDAATTRSRE